MGSLSSLESNQTILFLFKKIQHTKLRSKQSHHSDKETKVKCIPTSHDQNITTNILKIYIHTHSENICECASVWLINYLFGEKWFTKEDKIEIEHTFVHCRGRWRWTQWRRNRETGRRSHTWYTNKLWSSKPYHANAQKYWGVGDPIAVHRPFFLQYIHRDWLG